MWTSAVVSTLQLAAISVGLASVLGVPAAWAAWVLSWRGRVDERSPSQGPHRALAPDLPRETQERWQGARSGAVICRWIARSFFVGMVASLAMPMIMHAAAWEATAGKFGWLPLTQTGSRSFAAFGGLLACGWIHGLFGTPIVALVTWWGTSRIPQPVIAQTRLDLGPNAAWWLVRLPIAMPWLVSSLLAVAVLAATEMTVADLYGFRTVADEFYLFYAANPSFRSVTIACAMPLVVAGVLWLSLTLARRRLERTGNYNRESWRDAASAAESDRPRPATVATAVLVCLVVTALVVVIPVVGLLVKAGHQVVVSDSVRSATWSLQLCVENLAAAPRLFMSEYLWTAKIAVLTGVVAILLAWPLASIARSHRRLGKALDLGAIVLVLMPGPVVGLLVVTVFQWQVPGFRGLYEQSLVPTVIALLFRAGPVAYGILRAAYDGIGDSIFALARLDVGYFSRFWWIERPLLGASLVLAPIAAAIVASGDVPATLPVVPPGVSTVGTRLFGLLHSGARYQEAALAFWYAAGVVLVILPVSWLRRDFRGK